jgi:hypothetical protein
MKFMKLAPLMLAALSIAPHVSSADGSFSVAGNHMAYSDAKEYCDTLGGHLPSIREIATYAISQGATGIKESSFPGEPLDLDSVKAEIIQMASQGYKMVQKKNLWMPQVDFYYNSTGFQEQSGGASLWTSSTNSSESSLVGGRISLIFGTEQKYTLSALDGSIGEDTAKTGRDAVICAMETIQAPNIPDNASPGSTVVTINPARIEFSAEGKTMYATILDSQTKKIETVALTTSNLGDDAKSIQISRDYCADQATKAASENKNLRLDLSYQKPDKFCSISDDTNYPVSISNAK